MVVTAVAATTKFFFHIFVRFRFLIALRAAFACFALFPLPPCYFDAALVRSGRADGVTSPFLPFEFEFEFFLGWVCFLVGVVRGKEGEKGQL